MPSSSAIARAMPQSVDAERAVLGAILINNEHFYRAVEALRSEDFYIDSHRVIYRHVADLIGRNCVADLITIQEELLRTGSLEKCGGMAYLSGLLDGVPHLVNVEHYIEIIRKKALLRQLIHSSNRIMAECFDQADEPEEILDRAEQLLFLIAEKRISGGFVSAASLELSTARMVEKLYTERAMITGIPTGFRDLDRMTSGFQPADLIILAARPSMGKAQPLDANVLTPSGFIPMADVAVGMPVINGTTGKACTVTGVYPQGEKMVFKVTFSDGTSTECCMEHLWWTSSREDRDAGRPGSVKSLWSIWKTLRCKGDRNNHRVPLVPAVEMKRLEDLPIDPYLLGLLLGDGSFSRGSIGFDKPEHDLQQEVLARVPAGDTGSVTGMHVRIRRRVRNNDKSDTKAALERLGLNGKKSTKKFIPTAYLMASIQDRWSLLCGLCDTDGNVASSRMEFNTSSHQLAIDVVFLARSLGAMVTGQLDGRTAGYRKGGHFKECSRSYRMRFYFPSGHHPARSEKHRRRLSLRSHKRYHRTIESIEPVGRKLCQCISVDDPNGLYVTDEFVVTHNTALCLNIASYLSLIKEKSVGIFSLEMSKEQLMMRLLCAESRVDAHKVRTGYLAKEDFRKIIDSLARVAQAKLFIDDSSRLTVVEMRAKCRRLKAEHGLDLVIVDYLGLMSGHGENRNQQVSDVTRGLKALAKELNVPVLALSQLNRGTEHRGRDSRPNLSDLRDSGSIEQDADLVLFIYREEVYKPSEENAGVAELIISKQRNGPIGIVRLAFLREFTRFETLMDLL